MNPLRDNGSTVLLVGIIVSIASGVILSLAGATSWAESLIIALLGGNITTILSLKYNIEYGISDVIRMLSLNRQLLHDDELAKPLQSIADCYLLTKESQSGSIYEEELHTVLDKCVSDLSSLSKGKIHIDNEEERIGFIIRAIESSDKSVRAVSYIDIGAWWSGPLGSKILAANVNAIARGLAVERIFIYKDDAIDDLLIKLVKKQVEAGLLVYLVNERFTTHDLRHNFTLCDGSTLSTSLFTREGKIRGGVITRDLNDIAFAKRVWDRLINLGTLIDDVNEERILGLLREGQATGPIVELEQRVLLPGKSPQKGDL